MISSRLARIADCLVRARSTCFENSVTWAYRFFLKWRIRNFKKSNNSYDGSKRRRITAGNTASFTVKRRGAVLNSLREEIEPRTKTRLEDINRERTDIELVKHHFANWRQICLVKGKIYKRKFVSFQSMKKWIFFKLKWLKCN